jgi:hypothetical protein
MPKTVSDETMFTVLPQLEATERDLKAKLRKKAKARMGALSSAKTPEEVRREWEAAGDDVGIRRAILSRYLKAVIVRGGLPRVRVAGRAGRAGQRGDLGGKADGGKPCAKWIVAAAGR